jgi:hypothetical protein
MGDQDRMTAELLGEVALFVKRFVVLSWPEARAIALWTLHTHALEAAHVTPYLSITSAEPECGKTRLLEVLSLIVARPWMTGRVTAAVLVRKVHAQTPTLLLDESDATFNSEKEYAEALRGTLNHGYRRGGVVSLCIGQGKSIDFQDFSVFGPKAIAGIGKLPDTVASRSIPIRLKRKLASEYVEKFRLRKIEPEADALRERLTVWAEIATEELTDAEPELPEGLTDRQEDSWEPLLSIADLAGGDEWPEQARTAAVKLAEGMVPEDRSLGVKLLSDCETVFNGRERVATSTLLSELKQIEEAPWGSMNDGRGLTPLGLSKILRDYGIRSTTVRPTGEQTHLRGYKREDFADVWARYLSPPVTTVTTVTTQVQSEIDVTGVTGSGETRDIANAGGERDVTDVTGVTGDGRDRARETPESCPYCGGLALDRTLEGEPYCCKCSRRIEVIS